MSSRDCWPPNPVPWRRSTEKSERIAELETMNTKLETENAELLRALKGLSEREDVLQYGARARGCWREYKERLTRARAAIANCEQDAAAQEAMGDA